MDWLQDKKDSEITIYAKRRGKNASTMHTHVHTHAQKRSTFCFYPLFVLLCFLCLLLNDTAPSLYRKGKVMGCVQNAQYSSGSESQE